MVPKANGDWRAILDLKYINSHIKLRRFRMETLCSIAEALQQGEFLTSLDLTEAYLHIPIFPTHRRFLCFCVGTHHYQFKALPFGLSTAPRLFTKILVNLVVQLRHQGIHIHPCLDDLLLRAPSLSLAQTHTQTTVKCLQNHGFLINHQKSHLQPSQKLHLGGGHRHYEVPILPTRRKGRKNDQRGQTDHHKQGQPAHDTIQCPGPSSGQYGGTPMGEVPCQAPPKLPQALPTPYHDKNVNAPYTSLSGQGRSEMVDIQEEPETGQVLPHPRVQTGIFRREPTQLGGNPRGSKCTGNRVCQGEIIAHQPTGTKSDKIGTITFPDALKTQTCPDKDRQCLRQGICEQSGRVPIFSSTKGSQPNLPMGRDQSPIVKSRAHSGDPECSGRLPEPTGHPGGGMVTSSESVLRNIKQIRNTTIRPLRHPQQQTGQPVPLSLSPQGSGGNGCSNYRLAPDITVCLSSYPSDSQGPKETSGVRSGGNPGSPTLAQEAMILQRSSTVSRPSPLPTRLARPSLSGPDLSPRPRMVELDRLAIEWKALEDRVLSKNITDTILSSRRDSTKRIYNITWKAFVRWCHRKKRFYMRPSLIVILEFLQEGIQQGLRPNTLRCQTAAIATVVQWVEDYPLTKHPLMVRFLKRAVARAPPQVHRFPSWNLNIVLQTLTSMPFEPIRSIPLGMLALKTMFLVAITSARRVSELGALSVRLDLFIFHSDKVVLRTDPTFRPKRDSIFHMSQEICLPTFLANARNDREHRWHKLDVRRSLKAYIKRAGSLRKSDCLLVNVQEPRLGQRCLFPASVSP